MHIFRTVCLTALVLTIGAGAAAQNQPRPQQPPQAAPAKPYKPVAFSPPPEIDDPAFAALHKRLGEAAQKKDRAALAALVVSKDFFWEGEKGDQADKKKSGVDNLSAALGLADKDGAGWDMLAGYAEDPTAAPMPAHKGAVCGPADPQFDGAAFEALLKATQTDIGDWSYPISPDIEVRSTPADNGAVIGKLGAAFVRVMPEQNPATAAFLRVLLPDGRSGYAATDSIAPFGNDQLCYVKEGGAWKIGGYVGGGDSQ
jgi:hypothetical protein